MQALKIALGVAGLALAIASPPARGQDIAPAVVAVPGTFLTTYATPAVVIPQGGSLSFINLDVANHDVVAKDTFATPTETAWCCDIGCRFPKANCPLFASALVGLSTTTTPILGVEDLEPGKVYAFYCTIHRGMFGKLIVLPAAP